jgi:hypothetical protein
MHRTNHSPVGASIGRDVTEIALKERAKITASLAARAREHQETASSGVKRQEFAHGAQTLNPSRTGRVRQGKNDVPDIKPSQGLWRGGGTLASGQ